MGSGEQDGARGHFPQQVWLWAAWKCGDVVGQGQLQGHGGVGALLQVAFGAAAPQTQRVPLARAARTQLCRSPPQS